MILENFYNTFLSWIESKLASDGWLWKLTLIALALSLFLAFPPYALLADHLRGGVKLDAWLFIQNQAQDLLHPSGMAHDVRRENMIFRWTLPALSFLTHHNVLLIVILQGIFGVFFLRKIGSYIFSISGDKVITALFLLALSNTFVCVWSFADIHGYGDGFAYFFLLLALLSRNRLIIFVSLQIAFFTDERAVIAGGYLILWWMVTSAFEKDDFRFPSLLKTVFTSESLVVWIAWVVYFWIRFYVQKHYFPHHSYSTIGTPVLFENAHRNGLGSSIWGAFEGTWLLLAAAALVLWVSRKFWLLLALGIGFAVLVTTGIYVHDIDRALAYGFPFILIAVYVLLKSESSPSIKMVLFFAMIICVGHPQVFYMGYNKILWLEPLPMKVLMYMDHAMHWNFFI